MTRGTNEKNVKLGQRGSEGVTWPAFEIFETLHVGNCWS